MKASNFAEEDIHSDEVNDIISKPPSWLLRRGISFILLTILIILGMSVFIRYPEIVSCTVKFNSENAPKVISAKVEGNLIDIMVKNGAWISKGTPIAYIESTADHEQVIALLEKLQRMRQTEIDEYNLDLIISPRNLNLGELQNDYQSLYLAYLSYLSSREKGLYRKQISTVKEETNNILEKFGKERQSLDLQRKQLELAEREYEKYKLLSEKKVISPSELENKEALLLAKRQTIPEMENSLLSYEGNLIAKKKELIDLDNQISEEGKKFTQALNSFISEAESWKKHYVLTSPSTGKLIYGDFLQINQLVNVGQKLFYINSKDDRYYGEVMLQQISSSRVKKDQQVLIKVRSYPYEEYGYIHGQIDYISEIPMRDSIFFTKVKLIRNSQDSLIQLKPGIFGDADIITEDKSLFKRMWDNLTKNLNQK